MEVVARTTIFASSPPGTRVSEHPDVVNTEDDAQHQSEWADSRKTDWSAISIADGTDVARDDQFAIIGWFLGVYLAAVH
jgi:hypothetical protein